MGINSGHGGKKHKKGKNKNEERKRELPFKEDGQEYARVINMLGNGRVQIKCSDGAERLGIIRGSMRKRDWVNKDDVLLVSLREFQDNKADVIFRFTPTEAALLKKYGENVPASEATMAIVEGRDDDAFDFEVDEIDCI
jgi:translation initiation factor 1A